LEEGEVTPLAKAPGAQFEISIDGTPRTYRDRKTFAIEAAEHLKRRHPNSTVVVRDLQSGEATTIKYKPIWGRADIHTSSRSTAMPQKPKPPPRPPRPPAPPPFEPLPPAA
jgi:hypothetical protein